MLPDCIIDSLRHTIPSHGRPSTTVPSFAMMRTRSKSSSSPVRESAFKGVPKNANARSKSVTAPRGVLKNSNAKVTRGLMKEKGAPKSEKEVASTARRAVPKAAVDKSRTMKTKTINSKSAAKSKTTKSALAETDISDLQLPDRDPLMDAVLDQYLEIGRNVVHEQLTTYTQATESARSEVHDATYDLAQAMERFMTAAEDPSGKRFMFRARRFLIKYLVDWDDQQLGEADEGMIDELQTTLADRA